MTASQQEKFPATRDLFFRLIHVAWPSTVESFLTAFVQLVDVKMVGGLGTTAIAAVGLTAQPRMVALVPFMALQLSLSALIARRKGQEDRDGANKALRLALLLAIGLTLAVSLGGLALTDQILRISGSQGDTHSAASQYFQIIIGGIGFQGIALTINAAQRGCGNTRIAFTTNLVSNLVNIAGNYLLIEGHFGFPALGVRGAAIATVFGTAIAAMMSLLSICRRDSFLSPFSSDITGGQYRQEGQALSRLYGGVLLEQVFKRAGLWLYAMLVARLGTEAFAVHQIGMNMLTLCFSVGDGLSIAVVSLTGQSLGAQQPQLAKRYLSLCQRIGLGFSALFSMLFFTCGKKIYALFSSVSSVQEQGAVILRFVAVIVFMQITQVIYFGCLRGAGDAKYITVVTFLSVSILRPLMGLLFCYGLHWGLYGAWLALICEQGSRLLLSWNRVRKGEWVKIQI